MKHFEIDARFVEDFISPLSNITDRAIIKINETVATTLAISSDNGIIFYASVPITSNVEECESLNIINIPKFKNIINYIKSGDVKIVIKDNFLAYNSPSIRVKYFLTGDGVIREPAIKIQYIEQFEYDTSFVLDKQNIFKILKMKAINKEVGKVYFKFKDDGVYVEFTDKTVENCDSIEQKVADSYEGEKYSLGTPVSFDIIRLIAQTRKDEFKVCYNSTRKIFLFEHEEDGLVTKYLISSLLN